MTSERLGKLGYSILRTQLRYIALYKINIYVNLSAKRKQKDRVLEDNQKIPYFIQSMRSVALLTPQTLRNDD